MEVYILLYKLYNITGNQLLKYAATIADVGIKTVFWPKYHTFVYTAEHRKTACV